MRETGNILAVYSGHDHNNDFSVDYHGISIGYGRKSGYGGYKGPIADHPGSRVMEVNLNGTSLTWDSWIRLETGEKCTQSHRGQKCGAESAPLSTSLGREETDR